MLPEEAYEAHQWLLLLAVQENGRATPVDGIKPWNIFETQDNNHRGILVFRTIPAGV